MFSAGCFPLVVGGVYSVPQRADAYETEIANGIVWNRVRTSLAKGDVTMAKKKKAKKKVTKKKAKKRKKAKKKR